MVTGQLRALSYADQRGLNRSNSGSPTTPASARKRCNAGSDPVSECGIKTHSTTVTNCATCRDAGVRQSNVHAHARHCIGVNRSQSYKMHAMPQGIVLYPGCAERRIA